MELYRRLAIKDVVDTQKYNHGIEIEVLSVPISDKIDCDFLSHKSSFVTPEIADRLSFAMHQNSPGAFRLPNMGKNEFSIFSAYFTLYRVKALIEWGREVGGKIKLHTFLNDQIDSGARERNAVLFRSGHLGTVMLPGDSVPTRVALLDCLRERSIDKSSPLHTLAITLVNNHILPVTSEGDPVKINEAREVPKIPINDIIGAYLDA